jgi:hypothetical protein
MGDHGTVLGASVGAGRGTRRLGYEAVSWMDSGAVTFWK